MFGVLHLKGLFICWVNGCIGCRNTGNSSYYVRGLPSDGQVIMEGMKLDRLYLTILTRLFLLLTIRYKCLAVLCRKEVRHMLAAYAKQDAGD